MTINLGLGRAAERHLACDLSHDYVTINADYTAQEVAFWSILTYIDEEPSLRIRNRPSTGIVASNGSEERRAECNRLAGTDPPYDAGFGVTGEAAGAGSNR